MPPGINTRHTYIPRPRDLGNVNKAVRLSDEAKASACTNAPDILKRLALTVDKPVPVIVTASLSEVRDSFEMLPTAFLCDVGVNN